MSSKNSLWSIRGCIPDHCLFIQPRRNQQSRLSMRPGERSNNVSMYLRWLSKKSTVQGSKEMYLVYHSNRELLAIWRPGHITHDSCLPFPNLHSSIQIPDK